MCIFIALENFKPMNILMVCLGNICRSPLAEGIMKKIVKQRNLDWYIDSAGTSSWHVGSLPDPRSIAVGLAHNLDITDQRARQIQKDDFEKFDYILAMDSSNYRNIIRLKEPYHLDTQLDLLLNYHKNIEIKDVPDPYYENNFEYVYQIIYEACEGFLNAVMEPQRSRVG